MLYIQYSMFRKAWVRLVGDMVVRLDDPAKVTSVPFAVRNREADCFSNPDPLPIRLGLDRGTSAGA